jgi:GMP synthase PP-ATPase subunit
MLDANALKEEILSAISGMVDSAHAQLLTSQTIANYLQTNL